MKYTIIATVILLGIIAFQGVQIAGQKEKLQVMEGQLYALAQVFKDSGIVTVDETGITINPVGNQMYSNPMMLQ